ncbi:MAG TPA: CRTAC1 family protein [Vicinamibacterales bacterium]|nr:CRTAC1 family protein [Vicinamibacterales bacterium]
MVGSEDPTLQTEDPTLRTEDPTLQTRSRIVDVLAAGLVALIASACSSGPAPASTAPAATPAPVEWFTESAQAVGIDFTHVNGASGQFYYPEILPPGVALFDYDNDGDLDVYLVQGHPLATGTVDPSLKGRLYRNDLEVRADGTRSLHFTDVTDASGITAVGFGFGVATGDVDNDGLVDLYLTAFGGCQLYRNNGNRTFTDITKQSGTANQPGFAVSAAFLDYDRDGALDLYVGNNVNYRGLDKETTCPNPAGARDYCPPQIYGGLPDRLYHNDGHGKFTDVSNRALPGLRPRPALGVSTADFNDDGWIDIYVADDGEDNLLWLNQQNGAFREVALASGAAVTAEGKAEASMGVDAGDFDNDGDEDLFMTELTSQGFNLYVNDGSARFRDQGAAAGLGPASTAFTGWGTSWFDYDNDGWLDTFTANGTIITLEGHRDVAFPYDQRRLLFRNLGNGRFEEVSARAGASFAMSESGRGAAFGDVDNDGDVDILVGNDAGRTRLLINNIGNRQHWVGLRLLGASVGRDMLGARVGVTTGDGRTLWRRVHADGSYASASDPRVLVGLGGAAAPVTVRVRWPDGAEQVFRDVAIDRWSTLRPAEANK